MSTRRRAGPEDDAMSMRRAEKVEVVESVQQELQKATVAVLAEYRGLTAGELDRLRKEVRQANGRCRGHGGRQGESEQHGGSARQHGSASALRPLSCEGARRGS